MTLDTTSGPTGGHAGGRERQLQVLRRALGVLALVLVLEIVGGIASGSLALLSDAGHVVTDLLGAGSALVAVRAAQRSSIGGPRSFGLHRLEVLAALANALLLSAVAAWIVVEAISRMVTPQPVDAGPMLVVGVVGLLGNLLVLRWFGSLEGDALHVEGARLEVLADTLGSVAVLVGGGIVAVTGWQLVDPLLGIGIGLFVLPRTARLGARAAQVLLQMAPRDLDVAALGRELSALTHVALVHDLHPWTLTSGIDVASVHLHLDTSLGPDVAHDLLDAAHAVFVRHGIEHATVQLEPPAHAGCDPHADWGASTPHSH